MKFLFYIFLFLIAIAVKANIYKLNSGRVEFTSVAPHETINAYTKSISGAVDTKTNSFLFTINMNSFVGFNSDLQREHFNENYVESVTYPTANFKGKIIDPIDYKPNQKYEVRAKGEFTIHGVTINKVLPCKLEVLSDGKINVAAFFKLDINEFNIAIPRIVNQKISKTVDIVVKCQLVKQ